MKKTIIVFAAITFLISCGDKKKTTTDNSSTTETLQKPFKLLIILKATQKLILFKEFFRHYTAILAG